VRLLIDQQLPPALKYFFSERGVEAVHVHEIGMAEASDSEIWRYAQLTGFDLVSKDEDFFHMVACSDNGPRLIWVRMGNRPTKALIHALAGIWPDLEKWIASGDRLVEIR
jgi:predicted nuclease of predicted toxin-antitoxin system